MPAVAQAAMTGSAVRAPATRTLTSALGPSRVIFRRKLRTKAVPMPNSAARIGDMPVSRVSTMTTSGSSRSIRLSSSRPSGSADFAMPRIPLIFASKWIDRNAPRKYSSAGMMAMTMRPLYSRSGTF